MGVEPRQEQRPQKRSCVVFFEKLIFFFCLFFNYCSFGQSLWMEKNFSVKRGDSEKKIK